MLAILKTKMVLNKISGAKLANFIGITSKSLSGKINEHTDFTRSEMFKIHSEYFPNEPMEQLFKSDKE